MLFAQGSVPMIFYSDLNYYIQNQLEHLANHYGSGNKWELILHCDKTTVNCSHFMLMFLNLKMSFYLHGF